MRDSAAVLIWRLKKVPNRVLLSNVTFHEYEFFNAMLKGWWSMFRLDFNEMDER